MTEMLPNGIEKLADGSYRKVRVEAKAWEIYSQCPKCSHPWKDEDDNKAADEPLCPKCGTVRPAQGWPRSIWRLVTNYYYNAVRDPRTTAKGWLAKVWAKMSTGAKLGSGDWREEGAFLVHSRFGTGEDGWHHEWERKPGPPLPADVHDACPYCGGETCPRCGGPLHA